MECYNVTNEYEEEDYPRNLQITETKGERKVVGPELESTYYAKAIKMWKVNIQTK